MIIKRLFCRIVLIGGIVSMSGCATQLGVGSVPFVTKNPKNLPVAKGQKYVSVCYNADNTNQNSIIEIAKKNCVMPVTGVKLFSHELILNGCPVLSKARATFICVLPKP